MGQQDSISLNTYETLMQRFALTLGKHISLDNILQLAEQAEWQRVKEGLFYARVKVGEDVPVTYGLHLSSNGSLSIHRNGKSNLFEKLQEKGQKINERETWGDCIVMFEDGGTERKIHTFYDTIEKRCKDPQMEFIPNARTDDDGLRYET